MDTRAVRGSPPGGLYELESHHSPIPLTELCHSEEREADEVSWRPKKKINEAASPPDDHNFQFAYPPPTSPSTPIPRAAPLVK